MNTIMHKAATRGHAAHGWLDSWHSFSFGGYSNPERVRFGALRVLNDDTVAPAMGFGKHAHDNMEIISIPLEGNLEHEDSMGNKQVIRKGDVQIMSAGTGIAHAEKNESKMNPVKFLQIWVFPDKENVTPRYDQQTVPDDAKKNKWATVVSPIGSGEGVGIHQNAWFSLGHFDAGTTVTYHLHNKTNGVYAFVLEGDLLIDAIKLAKRDGLGISDAEQFALKAKTDAEILLMEIPMY